MYNSQEIANRIKFQVRRKKLSIKDLLSSCELGINTISNLAKGQTIAYVSLAKIADYLNCSVDYLLGRTDNSNILNTVSDSTINGVVQGNNILSNVVIGDNNTHKVIDNNTHKEEIEFSKQAIELMKIFENLGVREQMELLTKAFDLESRNKKNKIL